MAACLSLARPAMAQTIGIEDVRVEQVTDRLEIVIQTSEGATLAPVVTSSGTTTAIDIPNARLQLTEGDRFFRESPAQQITSISAIELDESTVRITLVGSDEAPEVQISQTETGVTISSVLDEEIANPEDSSTAADATDDVPSTSTLEDAEFTLGEIIIEGRRLRFLVPEASTATRTDTLIENTPLSIQVIPREAIDQQGATRLTDVLRNTSGVSTGNVSDGSDEYRIRGFDVGTIARDGYRESLFLERSSPRDTANIEQVEVLRGPAAILFGSLDAGGTINLITKQPEFTQFLDLSVTAGSFDTYRSEIDFNYPISEDGDLRARVNAAYEDSGSFRDFTDIERIFVAPTLAWDISDRARLNLSGEYLLDNRPFDRGLVALGDAIADIPFSRRLGNPFDELVSEELRLNYQFEYDLSDRWQLRNGVGYTRIDRSRINTQPAGLDEETGILSRRFFETDPDYLETFVVRGEVAGDFDTGENVNNQLVMGVEWIQQRRNATVLIGGAPEIDVFNPEYQDDDFLDGIFGLPIVDSSTRAINLGLYAQNTTDINDTVFILAGGRLEFINDKNDDFLFGTTQDFSTTEFIP
ncbi:MAG: TonB-dependent receptor, partial [Cyanobacteria bacterium J06639_1]